MSKPPKQPVKEKRKYTWKELAKFGQMANELGYKPLKVCPFCGYTPNRPNQKTK